MKQIIEISEMLQKARREEKQGLNMPPEERPGFHLTACEGWLNDPNGFNYYQGMYHLFYQYNPYSSKWGPMHWGHAVSRDLLHWEYLPAALAPDQEYDREGCFSGSSAELPDGKLLLMYTGVRKEAVPDGEQKIFQTQCLAVGDGRDFEKFPGNPVIDESSLPEGAGIKDCRDPKIVPWEDGTLRCVIANRDLDGDSQILFYRSADGFSWEFVDILFKNYDRYGIVWECPDLFRLEDRWILIVSPMDMLPVKNKYTCGDTTICLIGEEGREPDHFPEGADQPLDYGIDFYAAQTIPSPDGRRILIGWMQNWDTITIREPEAPWAGQMTLPRELFLRDGRLCQRPLRELEQLRGEKTEYKDVSVSGKMTLPEIRGRMADLEIHVRPKDSRNPFRTFTMNFAENAQRYSSLRYRFAESTLKLDRKFSGTRRAILHECECVVENPQQELRLRVILDRYSVEVFAEDGAKVMTAAYYTEPDAEDISFSADGEAEMDIVMYPLIP